MDSSPEDDFTWADTSNVSSDQSLGGDMAKEQESDFDKSFKRKLQKELFENGDHREPAADEPRVKKKKKIKHEPGSPSPARRLPNGPEAAAERFLRAQVKRERAASPGAARGHGHEHKRDRAERDDAEEPPRKKKKKRKRAPSDAEDAVVDKLEAEETVVDEFEAETVVDKFEAEETVVDEFEAQTAVDKFEADETAVDKFEADETVVGEFEAETVVDKFEAEETVVGKRRPEPRPQTSPAPRAVRRDSREFVRVESDSDDERSPAPTSPAPSSPDPASPASPSPAPLKIRERITFEEEPEERSPSDPDESGRPRARRLARYLRARPRLRPAPGAAPDACVVGAGEDAWLVLAPRGLPAAALAGAALAPGARRRLRAAGRQYEALPEPARARAALLSAGRRGGPRARRRAARVARRAAAARHAPASPAAGRRLRAAARRARARARAPGALRARPRPRAGPRRDPRPEKKEEEARQVPALAGAGRRLGLGARHRGEPVRLLTARGARSNRFESNMRVGFTLKLVLL